MNSKLVWITVIMPVGKHLFKVNKKDIRIMSTDVLQALSTSICPKQKRIEALHYPFSTYAKIFRKTIISTYVCVSGERGGLKVLVFWKI